MSVRILLYKGKQISEITSPGGELRNEQAKPEFSEVQSNKNF